MYKKGTAVEIQFSPDRLNDGAGDPYWIDLTVQEAHALLRTLQTQLADATAAPVVFSLDDAGSVTLANRVAPIPSTASASSVSPDDFKQWVCVICGWIYDEAAGLPEEGIAPGTRWVDVPEQWRCPLCDVGKDEFAMVEF